MRESRMLRSRIRLDPEEGGWPCPLVERERCMLSIALARVPNDESFGSSSRGVGFLTGEAMGMGVDATDEIDRGRLARPPPVPFVGPFATEEVNNPLSAFTAAEGAFVVVDDLDLPPRVTGWCRSSTGGATEDADTGDVTYRVGEVGLDGWFM